MGFFKSVTVIRIFLYLTYILMCVCKATQEENCPRVLEFSSSIDGRALVRHVFKDIGITSPHVCRVNCFTEPDCVSFNVGPLQDGKHRCELSDSDHRAHPGDLIYETGMTYTSVVNLCSSNPCPLNSRCQTGFTAKGYRCVCTEGFTGQDCSGVIAIGVTASPKLISTQKGQHVTFTCSATGPPNPVITWSELQGSVPVSRSVTSEGKLTILNATMADSGSYMCNATTAASTNSSTVELKVFCSLIYITEPTWSVVLYVGQALKISCPTSSGSEMMILWLYNGTTTLPQGALIETPDALIIPSLSRDHGGNYSCVSGNSLQFNTSVHVKHPETCSSVKTNICDVSSDYVIDPDGEQGEAPFTVYCNMTDKGGVGVTAVSHDSEDRTHVKRFDAPGSYRRDIHYIGSSLSQLKGLTEASKNCQQFIKYECKGSMIFRDGDAWWVSRDDEKMSNWDGTTPGCACGMDNSCANSQESCNCDLNDNVWREDSGLLTDKAHLPVSQLRYGDTGESDEEGYHTLGKLECYGIN